MCVKNKNLRSALYYLFPNIYIVILQLLMSTKIMFISYLEKDFVLRFTFTTII